MRSSKQEKFIHAKLRSDHGLGPETMTAPTVSNAQTSPDDARVIPNAPLSRGLFTGSTHHTFPVAQQFPSGLQPNQD
jgi:hypothetical protein